jgi:putative transposase
VLDILVQRQRNKQAAKKFFRKLLKGLRYVPIVIITDKLRSYSAMSEVLSQTLLSVATMQSGAPTSL